jgi:hypothetical protein
MLGIFGSTGGTVSGGSWNRARPIKESGPSVVPMSILTDLYFDEVN